MYLVKFEQYITEQQEYFREKTLLNAYMGWKVIVIEKKRGKKTIAKM